jgi:hypothetical protein
VIFGGGDTGRICMENAREKKKRGKTATISDILPQIIEAISKKAGGRLPLIAVKWSEIVGEQVANHTTPSGLRGKQLMIDVDDSVWMAELARFHKRRIMDAVNHNLEGAIVNEIIFRPKRKS